MSELAYLNTLFYSEKSFLENYYLPVTTDCNIDLLMNYGGFNDDLYSKDVLSTLFA